MGPCPNCGSEVYNQCEYCAWMLPEWKPTTDGMHCMDELNRTGQEWHDQLRRDMQNRPRNPIGKPPLKSPQEEVAQLELDLKIKFKGSN